jgi:hypothetical protein
LTHIEDSAGIKVETSSLDDSFMTEPQAKEEKVIVKSPQVMAAKKIEFKQTKDDKLNSKSDKDFEIVTSKVDADDSSKYVVPLNLPKEEPKQEEVLPKKKEKKQKELISEDAAAKAKTDYKIETTSFDDADVAERVKSPDVKKELREKVAREEALKPREYKKAEEPIKNVKDLHEELIKDIRKSDSSLRIEVSNLNDEAIDDEIENHKDTLKIAEQKRALAEETAAKI